MTDDLFAEDTVTAVPGEPEYASNYDPPENERMYFRSTNDSQLGWLVIREGKQAMKLDRAAQDLWKVYRPGEWIPEKEARPLTRMQVAAAAYEFDQKLALLFGRYDEKRTPWPSLREETRIQFMQNGPASPPAVRKDVYRAIMAAMGRVIR